MHCMLYDYCRYAVVNKGIANKTMHKTNPARRGFHIRARSKVWRYCQRRTSGQARNLLVIVGVSNLPRNKSTLAVAVLQYAAAAILQKIRGLPFFLRSSVRQNFTRLLEVQQQVGDGMNIVLCRVAIVASHHPLLSHQLFTPKRQFP